MCAKGCNVHINFRKTTCLNFLLPFSAKHETFLFFSHRPKPSISETCVLGHKQGKIRQNLETPLSFCSRHPIVLKLCTCQYKPIIHCLQHLWCLEYHIFYFKVSVCDFRGFNPCVVTCTNKNMSCLSFSQIPTLEISIPPITLIPTLKDVVYPTHHVYILGFSFHQFFSLLSTILFFGPPQTCVLDTFQGKTVFSTLSVSDSITIEDMDLRPVPYVSYVSK